MPKGQREKRHRGVSAEEIRKRMGSGGVLLLEPKPSIHQH